MMPAALVTEHSHARCLHCGHAGTKHRARDNQCPRGPDFPRMPVALRRDGDDAKAGARWDRAIALHWSTGTTYRPRIAAGAGPW